MYCLCFDEKCTTEFLSAGRFVAVKPNLHAKRVLKEAVLLFGVEGECPMAQDGRKYILRKGDYMILFPEHEHKGIAFTGVGQSHYWCHFWLPDGFYIAETEDLTQLRNNGICILPEFSHICDFEKFFILFSQLIDAVEDEKQSKIIVESYLKILLCSLSCEYAKCLNNDKKQITAAKLKEWARIVEYNKLSVAAAAKALGYNQNYFSRLIKQETGYSPIEFINILKLKRAKNLLLNSNMKIAEVADESGFADEKYFIKVFKKYESLTPSGFRSAYFRRNINVE